MRNLKMLMVKKKIYHILLSICPQTSLVQPNLELLSNLLQKRVMLTLQREKDRATVK